MEQLSVILRFVLLNEFTKKIEICEHFIQLCLITDSTGAVLYNYVTDLLVKLNLSIYDLRGQGHDNGAYIWVLNFSYNFRRGRRIVVCTRAAEWLGAALGIHTFRGHLPLH